MRFIVFYLIIIFWAFLPFTSVGQKNVPLEKLSYNELDSLGQIYCDSNNYSNALPYYKKAVIVAKKMNLDSVYACALNNLGRIYYQLKDYPLSISNFQEALAIRKQLYGVDHLLYGKYVKNLADAYQENSTYNKAIPLYKISLEIQKSHFGTEDTTYSLILAHLAFSYYALPNYKEAIVRYQQNCDIRKKIYGEEHPNYISSLNNLAGSYFNSQKYSLSEKLYKQILTKREKKYGKKHIKYISTVHTLANQYRTVGDLKKAENLYLDALNANKENIGAQETLYATCLHNLAFFYDNTGQYPKAIPVYKQAIEIKERIFGKKHQEYAQSINNLAVVYYYSGNFSQAEKYYLEAKNIRQEILGKNHPDYANSVNNLGALYHYMRKYDKAEVLYLEGLELNRKKTDKTDYATSLNNLAALYYYTKRYHDAITLFEEAAIVRKQIFGSEHPQYAGTINNLGALYYQTKEYLKAEKLYLETKMIREKTLGKNHPLYASILHNIAKLYVETERYSEAEQYYLKSLAIRKRILGGEHSDVAGTLSGLGQVAIRLKQFAKAEEYFLEATLISKRSLGIYHSDYNINLVRLANSYTLDNKSNLAWGYLIEVLHNNNGIDIQIPFNEKWLNKLEKANSISFNVTMEVLESLYNLLQKSTSIKSVKQQQEKITELAIFLLKKNRDKHEGKDKLRILAQSSDWLLKCLNVIDKSNQVDIAFKYAEQNKSALLIDAIKAERAFSFGNLPDSLIKEEQNLNKNILKIEANLIEKRPKSEKDSLVFLLNTLHLKKKAFLQNLNLNFSEYASLKYQQTNIAINEVQELLNNKQALLEYVIGDSSVYIFYIDSKNQYLLEQKINKKELNNRIKKLHYLLSNYAFITKNKKIAYQDYISEASWFFETLIQPIINKAEGITDLIIVTDGELGHLPFESFISKKPSPNSHTSYANLAYLINDFKISYSYSASLLKENKQKGNKAINKGILGIASNYNITLDSTKTDLRLPVYKNLRELLMPLPAARKEVEVLSEQFDGYFIFDSLASEAIFKENASQYGVIHLAMHGLLDQTSPILSSLAFSEDSDSFENNFLHAFEISKMKLNADLVVLSACETGYGKFEKGNGIASLARAFMYAGVPSLVVSLWQVNDYSTSEIMKNFYHNLSDGMDKAEALRQAKLSYIKNAKDIMAHPAFWSPFIQLGDSRSINLTTKKSPLMWLGIGSLVCLLLGIVIRIRRRKESTV